MCGRFTLRQSTEAIADAFQLADIPDIPPRYNIAPTQPIAAVVIDRDAQKRQLTHFYWGLIPSWSKDPKIGSRLINARAETVSEKPSFRTAFKRRRCLIVADGFYEWQRQDKKDTAKQPFYFCMSDRHPFAFAGLWEYWESPEGDSIRSCTILTTEANDLLATIHDRMPVILSEQDYDQWLDPTLQKPETLQPLLCPYPDEEMISYPVGAQVNNPKHDGPDCINPLEV